MTEIAPPAAVLELDGLRVSYVTRAGEINVIPGLSLSLRPNETLGLVGESGCGKSTVALAIMRYLGTAGRITGGRILLEGRDITGLDKGELRRLRGNRVAMVYQDPASSLNPVMTVGRQLMEVPLLHGSVSREEARQRALTMLEEVNLPDPGAMMERFPHQLSGGQQQRIVIAMALVARPALLILDEPTTGLDVTVEAAVLDLVAALRRRHGTAILFISHNLGTIARLCDRVGVMYAGELVETGPVRQIFRQPRHPYTRGLLDCLPTLGRDKGRAPLSTIPGQVGSLMARPPGCQFASRCAFVDPPRCTTQPIALLPASTDHGVRCIRLDELPPWRPAPQAPADDRSAVRTKPLIQLEDLEVHYGGKAGLFSRSAPVRAVNGVTLQIGKARTLAIVGESGSGKSTIAKALAGLERVTGGRIRLDGVDIGGSSVEERPVALKRRLQMVFQNPDSTLNPSHTVGYSVARALRRLSGASRAEAARGVERLFEAVRLPASLARRRPHQLSGGQKQRAAIARALAGDPETLIADEPVSALDVSVQAAIVNLLSDLQAERGQTLVFISHDLAVVRYLADDVAVMYLGRIVEAGTAAQLFAPPFHPYTEALLSAVPQPDPDADMAPIVLEGPMPRPTETIAGCPFASRCPRHLGPICDQQPPPMRGEDGHGILCHIPLAELKAAAIPASGVVPAAE